MKKSKKGRKQQRTKRTKGTRNSKSKKSEYRGGITLGPGRGITRSGGCTGGGSRRPSGWDPKESW